MNSLPTERSPQHIKLRFRKMNPVLDRSREKVMMELFDAYHEELLAIYLPYEDFQYGDFLYFTLASNDYLHNGPLPMFLKIEFREGSYERHRLPFAEGLSKTYSNMGILLAHSYVSDSPNDIFLDTDNLEKWQMLGVGI